MREPVRARRRGLSATATDRPNGDTSPTQTHTHTHKGRVASIDTSSSKTPSHEAPTRKRQPKWQQPMAWEPTCHDRALDDDTKRTAKPLPRAQRDLGKALCRRKYGRGGPPPCSWPNYRPSANKRRPEQKNAAGGGLRRSVDRLVDVKALSSCTLAPAPAQVLSPTRLGLPRAGIGRQPPR